MIFSLYYLKIALTMMQLQIKKTVSLQEEEIRPNVNHSETVVQNQGGSEYGLSTLFRTRSKVPTFMQQSFRNSKGVEGSLKDEPQQQMKKSKLGSMFRSKIKDMRKIVNCEICESQMKKEERKLFISNCEHRESFCESCLHHYAIYKIKTFEEVRCPREDCNALLDTNADFFKQLPADVQRAYRKLHQFYVAAEDPNVKLCPKENCEGLIRTTLQGVMVCDKCEAQFCAKCLLGKHQGECEKQELVFFEQQLHYRQCKKCKFVIEKNQGCNHMTCRCHYQFCYVCGEDWSPPHYNEHDQNGRLIVNPNPNPNPAPVHYNNNAEACCDCSCCEDCCGQTLACIFKSPLKLILIILYIVFMILIFVSRDLMVILGMSIVCILAGMFGFSFEALSELDGWCCLLGVIFFPILMIIGIGMAYKEIFCDVVPDLCGEYWEMFCDGCKSILEI